MADRNPFGGNRDGVPRRKPVPLPPQPLPEDWAAQLTAQFRRTLSTKRMNALSSRPASLRRSSSRAQPELVVEPARLAAQQSSQVSSGDATPPATSAPPPSYASLRNIPTEPTPPTDQKSLRFRSMMMSLSNTPCRWENPGLLDEALRVIPLERIYGEAQEESDLFAAEAASLGPNTKPAWGYQDCVVRALMKWFKRDFFEWVNNPRCSACRSPTVARGMAAPLPDEQARSANRVELYQCSHPQCGSFERFPRYNDAFVLLQTRRGRCGEWANCFSMLCRAVGSRVRWVWNAEDRVWTEVYSVHRSRWIHIDCCEEAWDAPLLYSHGWSKKMSYCIAFSADGCADVTRRYVRSPTEHAMPRTKCTEGALLHIVREVKSMRRADMDKKQKFALQAEDLREDAELRRNIIEALAYSISRILPGGDGPVTKGSRQPKPTPTQLQVQPQPTPNPPAVRQPGSDENANKAAERRLARQQRNAERNAERNQGAETPRDRQQEQH